MSLKDPSPGAIIISLDDQQAHNRVASNNLSLGAAISLDRLYVHNRVANEDANLVATITPDRALSDTHMDPPFLVRQNLAIQFDQDHPRHQDNPATTANPSRFHLQPHVRDSRSKLYVVDAQTQGQSRGIVGITTPLDGGLRLGVLRTRPHYIIFLHATPTGIG